MGSGKSTVASILKKQGFPVVDADLIAHELLENDFNCRKKIKNKFKTTSRKELAALVFKDKKQKKTL